MNYVSTLISVKNMETSKQFYHDVLGLDIIADLGSNVTLSGGFALQTIDTWQYFIAHKTVHMHNNAMELVFEETDFDAFLKHLKIFEIEYVHDVKEHSWGQRVIRFYDPDYHIIEVGEAMETVVKRFQSTGMTETQIADRMHVPLEYVQDFLQL